MEMFEKLIPNPFGKLHGVGWHGFGKGKQTIFGKQGVCCLGKQLHIFFGKPHLGHNFLLLQGVGF